MNSNEDGHRYKMENAKKEIFIARVTNENVTTNLTSSNVY